MRLRKLWLRRRLEAWLEDRFLFSVRDGRRLERAVREVRVDGRRRFL